LRKVVWWVGCLLDRSVEKKEGGLFDPRLFFVNKGGGWGKDKSTKWTKIIKFGRKDAN